MSRAQLGKCCLVECPRRFFLKKRKSGDNSIAILRKSECVRDVLSLFTARVE